MRKRCLAACIASGVRCWGDVQRMPIVHSDCHQRVGGEKDQRGVGPAGRAVDGAASA